MRPEEIYTFEVLADVYSGSYSEGPNNLPPDGFLSIKHQKIAVEVTRLIQNTIDENCNMKPRLADDAPAYSLIKDIEKSISNKIPPDKCVFIRLPTPISNVRKINDILCSEIVELVKSNKCEKEIKFNKNDSPIYINIFSDENNLESKITAAFPNVNSSTYIQENTLYILNDRIVDKEKKREKLDGVNEYWLALINEYWLADANTYLNCIEISNVSHGFDRIILISENRQVTELFNKI
ncbi:hypothetical protein [Photobacterium minamisatsumaniensis]|uniref:hypothetical protein n=1 Tax=Photobacterium minamisatsumaniensis TaxID=2910233 RepID=UPI003D0C57D1